MEDKKENSPNMNELVDMYFTALSNERMKSRNDNIEFEVRFDSNSINQIVFENIFKKLYQHGFKIQSSSYNMKTHINFDSDGSTNMRSKIRAEIDDLVNIQNYCKSNLLPEKHTFVLKEYIMEQNRAYQNNDFRFRTSIQKEITLKENNQKVKDIKSNWGRSMKTFRYIYRTSLVNKEEFPNIRVDLSKVKMNKDKKSIKVSDSNVFNMPDIYEVEIEIINPGYSPNHADIVRQLKAAIKYVLIGIQGTNFPQKYESIKETLNSYLGIVKRLNKEDKYYKKVPKNFIGPSSYTLQKENLIKHENLESVCIQDEFCVTDKADGERKILFVNGNNELYLLNTNLDPQYTGIKISSKIKKIKYTIIDGEHIEYDKYGNYINLYAAFDLYVVNGNDIRKLPFYEDRRSDEEKPPSSEEHRYKYLQKIVSLLNHEEYAIKSASSQNLNITTKEFFFSKYKDGKTIFDSCRTLLTKINGNTYPYNTDGIIFTSKHLGVTQEHPKDFIKKNKYTWGHSFKWKPPQYNTIDFLISVKKDNLNNMIVKRKTNNGKVIEYYELDLQVGFNHKNSDHGHLQSQMKLLDKNFGKTEMKHEKGDYRPVSFYPTNPSDQCAHICHVELKKDDYGNMVMYTEEDEVIDDDVIVEFSYDVNEKDRFMAWKPLRIRFDKTSDYKATKSNFGNAYHVANSNWQSIHNPITEDMLINGRKLDESILENTDKDVYYNKIKTQSQTISMRNFHNLYVKNFLIRYCASKQSNTNLIDLAVGKAGDLPKWIHNNVKGVLGVDISKDNIHNTIDGACARYINAHKKHKKVPFGMFIVGDSSKLLKNGDFQNVENSNEMSYFEQVDEETLKEVNEKSFYILQALMGNSSLNISKIQEPYLKEHYGIFSDKFDVCSIQFAIHYMFENKKKLHNFLTNVSEYTKMGKYFIGTCYDGKVIYDMLKDKEKDEYAEIYKNGNKIWHIKKNYENSSDFESNSVNSLGYSISVFQETINKEFDEYLVNFDYFIKVMEDYGFVLEENIGSIKSCDNFEELFKEMNKEEQSYGQAKKMTQEEKQISFLNRYFIFRKVNEIISPIYDEYSNEQIDFHVGQAKKIGNKKIVLL